MSNENHLHFIYLEPSDYPVANPNPTPELIHKAALHMQAWCRWQMGNAKTFTPVFASYKTAHPAEWYREFDQGNVPHPERYWANAQLDARDYGGATFYQEHDSFVVYVDAEIGPDQHAGGTGVNGSGIAVLHGKDCAALRGEDPEWTQCRAIGGHLHEALHTLGIPHPPAGPEFGRAVMGTGYMTYPNAILTAEDKFTLDHHRFFAPEPKRLKPPTLCPFPDGRPVPPPRPHPRPTVRPK